MKMVGGGGREVVDWTGVFWLRAGGGVLAEGLWISLSGRGFWQWVWRKAWHCRSAF